MFRPTLRESRTTIAIWLATLVIEGGILLLVRNQPIWRDLLRPFMILALLPAALATWRLLRPRSGRDRRAADRRGSRGRMDDGRGQTDGHPPATGLQSGS